MMNERTNADPAAEQNQSLWILTVSPVVWAIHFLACYLTAAIWCEKVDGGLMPVRLAILGYTVVALAAIAVAGWSGLRKMNHEGGDPPHDGDTPEDRHRFLGLSTLLLSGLSFVAVLYAAMAALFFRSCI